MSTSPFSTLSEAIKKVDAALSKVLCTICNDMSDRIREIKDAHHKEIERLEAEALAQENAEASTEAVPFDVMLEKMEEFDRECRSITRQEAAMFWNEDAQIFSEKMAARQNEVVRAMENESARQAMKRRKLLHAEGHFPDMAR